MRKTCRRMRENIRIADETSESYWKMITERRKQAIEETIAENIQVEFMRRISF